MKKNVKKSNNPNKKNKIIVCAILVLLVLSVVLLNFNKIYDKETGFHLFKSGNKLAATPQVSYLVHVQKCGWISSAVIQSEIIATEGVTHIDGDHDDRTCPKETRNENYVSDGQTAGTTGAKLRVEAIKIKLENINSNDGGIRYKSHIQSKGWGDWVSNNDMSGTAGDALRMEAIRIELTGAISKEYDVYYRVHSQTFGWLGWAKNGEPAGSRETSKQIEAIQIKLLPKNTPPSTSNLSDYNANMSTFVTGQDE